MTAWCWRANLSRAAATLAGSDLAKVTTAPMRRPLRAPHVSAFGRRVDPGRSGSAESTTGVNEADRILDRMRVELPERLNARMGAALDASMPTKPGIELIRQFDEQHTST